MPSQPNPEPNSARAGVPPERAAIASLDVATLLARYEVGVENLDRRVLSLPEEMLDTAFLPSSGVGRWPVRVLVGHLADSEIAFTQRIRRLLCEENPVLHNFDEDAPIDAGLYWGAPAVGAAGARVGERGERGLPIAGSVAVIHTLRRWTIDLLRRLDDGHWARSGLHPLLGVLTVRDVVVYTTWHMEHHAGFLRLKLDRLLPAGANP